MTASRLKQPKPFNTERAFQLIGFLCFAYLFFGFMLLPCLNTLTSIFTVKDAAGTSYVVSTDNNGKYYFIMPDVDVTITVSFSKNITADPTNPKTGDEFAVVLWSGIMMTSLLCMAVIIPSRKKFR